MCIVLRAVNYRDNDRILTLFSRTEGKINAQATGARRIKSGLAPASQPFCCAEYEFFQKKDRYFVTGALIKQEFFGIQNDYDKFAAGCVMLELTERMLEHSDEPERLFATLINTLYSMEKYGLAENTALAYFFVQAIDMLGVFPALDFCSVCGAPVARVEYWSAEQGGAVCEACARAAGAKRPGVDATGLFGGLLGVKPRETARLSGKVDYSAFLYLAEEYIRLAGDIKLKTSKYLKPQ